MARKLRIQYPGAIYHVMNRGDRREAIFGDDEDRQRLLETLTEACQKTGWQVHAYCLSSSWALVWEEFRGLADRLLEQVDTRAGTEPFWGGGAGGGGGAGRAVGGCRG